LLADAFAPPAGQTVLPTLPIPEPLPPSTAAAAAAAAAAGEAAAAVDTAAVENEAAGTADADAGGGVTCAAEKADAATVGGEGGPKVGGAEEQLAVSNLQSEPGEQYQQVGGNKWEGFGLCQGSHTYTHKQTNTHTRVGQNRKHRIWPYVS